MKMKIFFGTDGWRALNGSQINEVSVAVIAQAVCEYFCASTFGKHDKSLSVRQYYPDSCFIL